MGDLRRRILRGLAAFLIVTLAVPLGTAATVLAAYIFLPLPASLPEADAGIESQISHIFDADGNEIGVFRIFEQSIPIAPGDIPDVVRHAVISAEDRSFYDHGGVDVRGTLRALWIDIRGGGARQGGSTITQQYVRNAYSEVGREKTIARKIREAVLASQLDRTVDKEEILFRYLSTVYFGNGAYGIGAAAETYFRKPVPELSLSEAAMLAGLIPAPSRYEPRGDKAAAEQKRKIVLAAMLQEGYITQEQHDAALPEVVHLVTDGDPGGPATLVHPPLRQDAQHPYFTDYLRRYLVERYGEDKVFRGGLQVFTTLDPGMQAAAEAATSATLDGTEPPLEMSLVAVEPPTGFVRALVGGRDFAAEQTNLALGNSSAGIAQGGGGSGRQPGSSFKPLVLAAGFENGIQPNKRYNGNTGICVPPGSDYCPNNYGNSNYGNIDLRSATRKSVNSVYVQLITDVGVQTTMDLARKMGISSSVYDPSRHGASIALGALSVSPLDMASSYGVFAARGLRQEPTPVIRVLDRDGNVLEDNTAREAQRVLREPVADNVNSILQGVLEPGGTAGGKGIGRPAAGKTGTTDDFADAWFVGYTPVLSTAVWMGHRDDRTPLRGIKGVARVAGGTLPASTWQRFMKEALADIPATDFNEAAPLRPIADQESLRLRAGFSLGRRRLPAGPILGGPYVPTYEPPDASAPPPPTTTTSTTTTSTTSTTLPIFPGNGNGNGSGNGNGNGGGGSGGGGDD